MRDLDGIDARLVERLGDFADMLEVILVAYGVHAVTQGNILNIQLLNLGIERHHATSFAARAAMIRSAVARPAEVMISRLPA